MVYLLFTAFSFGFYADLFMQIPISKYPENTVALVMFNVEADELLVTNICTVGDRLEIIPAVGLTDSFHTVGAPRSVSQVDTKFHRICERFIVSALVVNMVEPVGAPPPARLLLFSVLCSCSVFVLRCAKVHGKA